MVKPIASNAIPTIAGAAIFAFSGAQTTMKSKADARTQLIAVCLRWKRRSTSLIARPSSANAESGCDWFCHNSRSSSNSTIGRLPDQLLQRILDPRNLYPYVVDRDAGDIGDLLVAKALQQQRDNQAVLVRQGGNGTVQRRQPLLIFQRLMRAATLVRQVLQLFALLPFLAIYQCRVDGDAVHPRADFRLAPKGRQAMPHVFHDLLKEIVDFRRRIQISEAQSADARLVLLEQVEKLPLSFRVGHRASQL